MDRRHIPDAEYKLVILYALNRLGPVTSMQLLQFLVEMNLMNYFTMQINLSEMIEQGQVVERAHPLGSLLLVTEAGAYTLGTFDHRIPSSRRQVIDEQAAEWHERFRSEQQTLADSFRMTDGGMCIRLRLLEADTALLDLILTLPKSASMTFLQRRWRSAAQDVYDALTTALSDGYDNDASLPPLPDTATLQQVNSGEWLLSLSDDPHKPAMTLMLNLPDEHLARYYAANWPLKGEPLRQLILRELKDGLEHGDDETVN